MTSEKLNQKQIIDLKRINGVTRQTFLDEIYAKVCSNNVNMSCAS